MVLSKDNVYVSYETIASYEEVRKCLPGFWMKVDNALDDVGDNYKK